MTLYSIDQRLLALEEYGVDSETGEVITTEEEFAKLFEEIQMDIHSKITNTALFIKNLESDCEQIKNEEKRLAQRRKSKENLIARLKENIDNYIKYRLNNIEEDFDGVNKWKLETPQVRISYRKSDKAIVTDFDKLSDEYKKVKTTIEPSLEDIKKAIKSGKEVEGAEVITNLNMQIK